MFNMTKQEIREQLPDECNTTLKDANIHLQSALESAEEGDYEQVAHEANMASLILHYIVLDYDEDLIKQNDKVHKAKD